MVERACPAHGAPRACADVRRAQACRPCCASPSRRARRSRRWWTTCSPLSGEQRQLGCGAAAAHPDAPRALSPRSDFCTLPPGARARLVDSLCSNLSVLGSSCGMLDATVDAGALGAHRSALKAYAFFLTHIVLASEAEAREAAPLAAPKVRTLLPNGPAARRPAPRRPRAGLPLFRARATQRAEPVGPLVNADPEPPPARPRPRAARKPQRLRPRSGTGSSNASASCARWLPRWTPTCWCCGAAGR